MDALTFLKYPFVIVVVTMISSLVKSIDKSGKYKRFYLLIPTVIGALASIFITMVEGWNWGKFGINVMLYVTTSTYAFKFGKTVVMGK